MISRTTLEKNERGMILNKEREMEETKFKRGDTVMVMNSDSKGNLIEEGSALILKKDLGSDYRFFVIFDSDNFKCYRNLNIPGTRKIR